MEKYRSAISFKRRISPCVGAIEAYKEASSPSKHNTILGCKDESFLKDIYAIEKNSEWRRMCIQNIHDSEFLEHVAKNDPNERVRKQAAINCNKDSLIAWLKDNDHSPLVRKYAKERFAKLPKSMKFILE